MGGAAPGRRKGRDGKQPLSVEQVAAQLQRHTACGLLWELYPFCPDRERCQAIVRALYLLVEWRSGAPLPPMQLDPEQRLAFFRLGALILQRHPDKAGALEAVRLLDIAVAWEFQDGLTRPDYTYFINADAEPAAH